MDKNFLIENWICFNCDYNHSEYRVITRKDWENNYITGVVKDAGEREIIGNFEKHITTNIHEALDKHLEYAEELEKLIKQNIKDNIEELIIKIHQIYSGINFLNNDYETNNKITMLKNRTEDLLKILKKYEENR